MLGPADIIVEIKTRAKNCDSPLQSLKGKSSYYLQAQQQMQCTGASFCILMSFHPESGKAKYFLIKRDDTLFSVCKCVTDSVLEKKVISEWPHTENNTYSKLGKILCGTLPDFSKLKLLRSYVAK